MWFTVGVIADVVTGLALSAFVAPAGIGILNLCVPLFGFLLGGAIAGWSLRPGMRGVVGFAFAFAFALPILLFQMIGIQGMSGNWPIARLVLDFGRTGALAFALMGAIGVAIAGLGWREVVRSTAVFGCAGFSGGFILALSQWASLPGARDTNQLLLLLGSIAFLVLPAAVGGSMLTRRLNRQNRLHSPTSDLLPEN